jgi:hypothetical protein
MTAVRTVKLSPSSQLNRSYFCFAAAEAEELQLRAVAVRGALLLPPEGEAVAE